MTHKESGIGLSWPDIFIILCSALRIKLGLKPLNLDKKKPDEEKESLKDDIHKPAINLGEKKRSETIREKLAAAKQKRLQNQKLGLVRLSCIWLLCIAIARLVLGFYWNFFWYVAWLVVRSVTVYTISLIILAVVMPQILNKLEVVFSLIYFLVITVQ